MLMKPEDRKSEFVETNIESLKKVIQAWEGSDDLRSKVLNSIAYLGEKSTGRFLHELVQQRVLEPQQESAWKAVRNKVMHGNLVSPWSTKDEDEHIIALANIVHNITRELAGVGVREQSPWDQS